MSLHSHRKGKKKKSQVRSLSDGSKVTGKPGNGDRHCRTELLLFLKGELQKVSVKLWQYLKGEKEQATQFGRVGKSIPGIGNTKSKCPKALSLPKVPEETVRRTM